MAYDVRQARLFSYENRRDAYKAQDRLAQLFQIQGVDETTQKHLWNLHALLIQHLIAEQGDGGLVFQPYSAPEVTRPKLRLVKG